MSVAALFLVAGIATTVARASTGDARTVELLVVSQGDVPALWDATIVRDPCPSTVHPNVSVTARAATRWGSPNRGIWSVAMVARTPSQSRLLFAQVRARLPSCLTRYWRDHYSAPGVAKPKVGLAPKRLDALGDARIAWTISLGRRHAFDVVVVRKGRAVAQYVYGWNAGLAVVRRAIARS